MVCEVWPPHGGIAICCCNFKNAIILHDSSWNDELLICSPLYHSGPIFHVTAKFLLKEKKQLFITFLEVALGDMGLLEDMEVEEFKSMVRIMGAWIGTLDLYHIIHS